MAFCADKPSRGREVAGSVSVIICTHDRPEALSTCLESLALQVRPPDEVIVVDNAPSDSRTQIVASAHRVVYVREDRAGLSHARNAGVKAAKGDFLVFTDDDAEVDPHWIQEIVKAFHDPDVMAATGIVLPARLDTQAQWIFEKHWSFNQGFNPQIFDSSHFKKYKGKGYPCWRIGAGVNMAFRKEAFFKFGLFDTRLGAGASGCSEDSEYWYRIISSGYKCAYEPMAVVRHHHRSDISALKQQIHSYMCGHVVGLLVQFEKWNDFGNIRRLFLSIPKYYFKLTFFTNDTDRRCTIVDEITGSLLGFLYYFRHRKTQ
ncbi:glycosyltransferase [Asticcacaulis sp. DW145]|uniref:glycosyltransferase family 2 protein n=1 Tax=Asticcacaulis sp. DW145 TaxID=3095608 RepID=UPI0030CEC497